MSFFKSKHLCRDKFSGKFFETCLHRLILPIAVFVPTEFVALIQFHITIIGNIQKVGIFSFFGSMLPGNSEYPESQII